MRLILAGAVLTTLFAAFIASINASSARHEQMMATDPEYRERYIEREAAASRRAIERKAAAEAAAESRIARLTEENLRRRAAWQPERTSIVGAAREFVRRNLKAPRSAEFPLSTEDNVSLIASGETLEYEVSGYVDAQNAFGAMLRNRWKARVWIEREGTEWFLTSVAIDP